MFRWRIVAGMGAKVQPKRHAAAPPLTEQRAGSMRIIEAKEAMPPGVCMIVEGVLGEVDLMNRNGRLYPRALMARELDRKKAMMSEKGMFALANHPDWMEPNAGSIDKIAGMVTEASINADAQICGCIHIAETDAGKNIAALVRAGARLGISQRGYGSVVDGETMDANGRKVFCGIVQDDYQLEGWDFVTAPSANANVTDFRESEEPAMTLALLLATYPDLCNALKAEAKAEGVTEGKAAAEAAAATSLTESTTAAEAVKAAAVTEAKAAAVTEAKAQWESEHAVGIAFEVAVSGRTEKVTDPKAFVEGLEAAATAGSAAKTKLETAAAVRTALRAEAGSNPTVFAKVEALAFDNDGSAKLDAAGIKAAVAEAIKTVTTPTDAPAAGAGRSGSGEEPPAPEKVAEDKRRLDSINEMRTRAGLGALDKLPS